MAATSGLGLRALPGPPLCYLSSPFVQENEYICEPCIWGQLLRRRQNNQKKTKKHSFSIWPCGTKPLANKMVTKDLLRGKSINTYFL